MGVIYRHQSMDINDVNSNYLNKLLGNIYKEQKSIFLLGNSNINLLNYNEHNRTNKLLDSIVSNSFAPAKITSHSNTFIDNTFSNVFDPNITSGNLIATSSDYLSQYVWQYLRQQI